MATRNSPSRRVPGSPLAGVLQQTARKARAGSGRSRRSATPDEGTATPLPGPEVVAATMLVTDATGTATFTFEPLQQLPVVAVTPVAAGPLLCHVAEVSNASATVRAWLPDGVTAAEGQTLHVVAFLAPNYTGPEQP